MSNRLDKILVENGFVSTRAKAQDAIKESRVKVNGKIITKSSFSVELEDVIELEEKELSFASRAGQKLYDVIEPFELDLKDKVVIDVGASHGGFTDVCLKQGASYVYAVDVGRDQLLPFLREDERVCNMEQTNCRYLEKEMFDPMPQFACMDVSFISIKLILPALIEVMQGNKEMVLLVKPQFEAGKADIGKNGIVKDEKVHIRVLQEMLDFVKTLGLYPIHLRKSSILGRDGNKEFVLHVSTDEVHRVFPLKDIVKK